jgi:hypothetical protein
VWIGFGIGALGLPVRSEAQFMGWDWNGGGGGWGGGAPGARDIAETIAERGFRLIAPVQRNGGVFVADVVDRRGRRERLILGPEGHIRQRFLLDDPRLPGYVPRYAEGSDGADDPRPALRADREMRPVPPGLIPGVGVAPAEGGDLQDGDLEPALRPAPRVMRPPRPRIVERTPDGGPAERDAPPPAVPGEPLPIAPRAKLVEPPRIVEPAKTASRPADAPPRPAPAPVTPAPVPVPADRGTSAKLSDPLRIPGAPEPAPQVQTPQVQTPQVPAATPRKAAQTAIGAVPLPATPTRSVTAAPQVVSGRMTGTPPAKPVPSVKPGDVPVAPLD